MVLYMPLPLGQGEVKRGAAPLSEDNKGAARSTLTTPAMDSS
jgi:hypothetical protein